METPTGHEQNADQIAYWNGAGGRRWAQQQQVQDGYGAYDVLMITPTKVARHVINVECAARRDNRVWRARSAVRSRVASMCSGRCWSRRTLAPPTMLASIRPAVHGHPFASVAQIAYLTVRRA